MKALHWYQLFVLAIATVSLTAVWASLYANSSKTKVLGSPGADEVTRVEQTIHNVFGWAVKKDFGLFFSSIGNDSNYISVTPYRVKFGVEAVKRDTGFWADPGFKGISHELHDLRISFSSSGDVAWFYCVLDDINEINGRPANWENARWTGVVAKKDGHWRVVQQHISFAVEH